MDILDELQDLLDCRRYDTYLAAVCVFHKDSSPSLLVHVDTYKCLACGAYGSTKSLLKKLSNGSIIHQPTGNVEVFDDLPNPFYSWLKKKTLKEVLKHAWEMANNNPHMITYLTQERNIDAETRRTIGIGVLEGFYTFPIRDFTGQIVGGFVRCPKGASKRYFVPKNQNPNLVYVPKPRMIDDRGVVFLTFGGIDAISLTQLGFAAISTTNGKRIDFTALDELRKKIVILPDAGEEIEARRIAQKLDWRGAVYELCYPDGSKDVNDYFRHSPEVLKQELDAVVKGYYK